MPRRPEEAGNLWLARALWEVGAVRFGDFTIGRSTVHSPVYINVRRIISRPRVLKRRGKGDGARHRRRAGPLTS